MTLQILPPKMCETFMRVAQDVVENNVLPVAFAKNPGNTGCCVALWVCLEDIDMPSPMWKYVGMINVGGLTEQDAYECGVICLEKGHRLIQNPHHILSFQSRGDEENSNWMKRHYPGAVRMSNIKIVISTSGFTWPFDEAVGLAIGERLGWMSREAILEAIEISDNKDAHAFFAARPVPTPTVAEA